MPRLRKCRICNCSIQPDEPSVPYEKGYAHEKCFQVQSKTLLESKMSSLQKKQKNKNKSTPTPKAELKNALSEEEYKEKQMYYDYLKQLVPDNKLTPKIYTLSEKYIKEHGVTFYNLYQTLVYLNEVVEKELKGDIVGILPFYISEAMNFYKEVKDVYTSAKNVKIADMYKTKVVHTVSYTKPIKQIDITSI